MPLPQKNKPFHSWFVNWFNKLKSKDNISSKANDAILDDSSDVHHEDVSTFKLRLSNRLPFHFHHLKRQTSTSEYALKDINNILSDVDKVHLKKQSSIKLTKPPFCEPERSDRVDYNKQEHRDNYIKDKKVKNRIFHTLSIRNWIRFQKEVIHDDDSENNNYETDKENAYTTNKMLYKTAGDPLLNFDFTKLHLDTASPDSPIDSVEQPFHRYMINDSRFFMPLDTQQEAFEGADKRGKITLGCVWNVWIESSRTMSSQLEASPKYCISWKVYKSIWEKRHIRELNKDFESFPSDCIESQGQAVHICHYGIKPMKSPEYYKGCIIIFSISKDDFKQMWITTNNLLLTDEFLWYDGGKTIYSVSWRQDPNDVNRVCLTFWTTMENLKNVNMIKDEISACYPDRLKPLFNVARYRLNSTGDLGYLGD